MSGFIMIKNNGAEVTSTNYYDTEHAEHGYFYLSINAGVFRLLVPDSQIGEIEEWRTAREVIVSRGPWPYEGKVDAIEVLFDDDTDTPYALQLSTEQMERMPFDADRDRGGQPPRWKFTAWTRAGKALELPCRYRLVKRIPCLKPFV